MTTKTIYQMTRKELLAVPERENWIKPVVCDEFIIIPTRKKHSSGYNMMCIVACKNSVPICLASTASDNLELINFNYLGNAGRYLLPQKEVLDRWRIDCLPKSNLIRVWSRQPITIGASGSDIDIMGYPKPQEE